MSNQLSNSELLHIATLGKSVGLKGFMKLHVMSDFPEQFDVGKTFMLSDKKHITIEAIDNNLVKIQGVKSPEDARLFINKKLFMTYQQTREECLLDKNQYFYFDIVGLAIFEDAQQLGIVETIERIAELDYLVVKTDNNLVSQKLSKTFLIPYKDRFVLHVDIDNKAITVSGGLDILKAS